MIEILNREYDELIHRDAEVLARGIEELEQGYSQNVVSLESEFVTAAKDQWEQRRQLVENNIETQKKLVLEKTKLGMISEANATPNTISVFAKVSISIILHRNSKFYTFILPCVFEFEVLPKDLSTCESP